MNTDAPWPTAELARARVLRIQTKLHQWATDDPDRRFDDLYNLVYDPAVLVGEAMIPKRGGKYRRLGIATVRDRVVQAALKTVLEPTLEADFKPCSYGFRPGRRVHDAIAEIHFFTSHSYEWVVEGDIKACFDEISHVGIQDRLRARVAVNRDRRAFPGFRDSAVGAAEPLVPRLAISRRPQKP